MAGYAYTRDPLLMLIQDIRKSTTFDRRTQLHVLHWIDDFRKGLATDPITRVTAALACRAFATHARVASVSMSMQPTNDAYPRLVKVQMDADLHLLKCLRIGGFRAKAMQGRKKGLPAAPTHGKARAHSADVDLAQDLSDDSTGDGTEIAHEDVE